MHSDAVEYRRRYLSLRGLRIHLIASICLHISTNAYAWERKYCTAPLGMESGLINDKQISASSSYVSTVGPQYARLNNETAGGGWCPKPQIDKNVREFLEVDLNEVHLLTQIATQGRHDRGRGQEYVEEYKIEYYRPKLRAWKVYRRWDGKHIFTGNGDTTTVTNLTLEPPIVATKIRIIPYSVHKRTVCARLEFYGCLDKSGLVSYTVPPSIEVPGDIKDSVYDGERAGYGLLINGLGRLHDGHVGEDSFTFDAGQGKGSGWVAWSNVSFPTKYVTIDFEFDGPRRFHQIDIYTNNFFDKQSQIFGMASVYLSFGGKYYNYGPINHYPVADLESPKARNVSINLRDQRALGKFVRLKLYFVRSWIMLSEVYFQSERVVMELEVENYSTQPDKDIIPDFDEYGNVILDEKKDSALEITIGVTCGLGLLLLIIVLIVYMVNRKKDGNNATIIFSNEFRNKITFKDIFQHLTPRSARQPDIQLDTYSTSVPKLDVPTEFPQLYYAGPLSNEPVSRKKKGGLAPKTVESPKRSNRERTPQVHIYHNVYEAMSNQDSDDAVQYYTIPDDNMLARSMSPSRSFSSALNQPKELRKPILRPHRNVFLPAAQSALRQKFYTTRPSTSADDLKKYTRTQPRIEPKVEAKSGFLWNIVPSSDATKCMYEGEIIPIPLNTLGHQSTLGHMFKSELSIYSADKLKTLIPEIEEVVLVRRPKFHKNEAANLKYLQEMRMLSSLRHVSVCCVIGVVTSEVPPLIVQDFSTAGDLYRLLSNAQEKISFQLMIFLVMQVCSAMEYLESRNIVHKDLAARNCMVFSNNVIKVTDFAMACSAYKEDYYPMSASRIIPVRWLSWESVLLDRYSIASTMWSFGVTAWEILSHCSKRPFHKNSNEQLILIMEHMYYGGEFQDSLPKPHQCPQELFQVLRRCWHREEQDRPTFAQLYKFMILNYSRELPYSLPC